MTRRSDLEARHAALLARIPTPEMPSALADGRMLEAIFERAAEGAARDLDANVRAELSKLEQPPSHATATASPFDTECENGGRECSAALTELGRVHAPAWVRSRVRHDLVEWTRSRRRAHLRRRAGFLVAAAALLIVSLPLFQAGFDRFVVRSEREEERPRREVSIVRHHVSTPLHSGYSTGAIIGSVLDAGGSDGR